MSNTVFANKMEVACKASTGKSICAFPDVCLTPPQTPATPIGVPIPYPNTGMASDLTDGTTTVQIAGKEVAIKDASCFRTSSGDEAGSAPKKGLVTSKTKGKVYFTAWSMDVKVEGQNVPRHLDLTTHNHASKPPNAMITAFIAKLTTGNEKSCGDEKKDCADKCKSATPHPEGGMDCSKSPGCAKAKACCLAGKDQDKDFCCHPNTTGHHLIEVHCFTATGGRRVNTRLSGFAKYNDKKAPCVCASEQRGSGSHGVLHAVQGQIEGAYNDRPGPSHRSWPGAGNLVGKSRPGARKPAQSKWRYRDAREAGVLAHKLAFPHCNPECIRKQLDKYHKDEVGCTETTPLRSDPGAETRSAGDIPRGQRTEMRDLTNNLRGVGNNAGI